MAVLPAADVVAAPVERQAPTASGIVWRTWGQGAPVVLLHDWGGCWRDWLGNVGPLAARFQVHVAELPRPSAARPPLAQDTLAWAGAIREDLLRLAPGMGCSLVGQGWGGSVAALLAPALAQLSSLVLLGAAQEGCARCAPPPPALVAQWLQDWEDLHAPVLMIWGQAGDAAFPVATALSLAAGREEREWMVLPIARHPMQHAHATEINAVLMPWLLSHG